MRRLAALLCLAFAACMVGDDLDSWDVGGDEEDGADPLALNPNPPELAKPAAQLTAADCALPADLDVGRGTRVALEGSPHPAWVYFTDPAKGKTNIIDETVRLIYAAAPGSEIRATIYSMDLPVIAKALMCARNTRGVKVRIVMDSSPDHNHTPAVAYLKDLTADELVRCGKAAGDTHGCISRGVRSIMHTKLYLFSDTTDPTGARRKNVVWFGSANMTNQTGRVSYNNVVTIFGDDALYAGALAYFRDLKTASSSVDNVVATSSRLYFSPAANDLVLGRLSYIHPDRDCEIRVAQAMFHDNRIAIVNRLKELKGAGCDVRVLGSDKNFEDDSRARFAARPNAIEARLAMVHDKYFTVKARYGAEPGLRYLVFTGSHNLAYGANYTNDELFARLEGRDIWQAYRDHWDAARSVSTAP